MHIALSAGGSLMLLLESTPTERAAYITYMLARGKALTAAEVARRTNITERGAQKMMARLSRTLPLYQDADYQWRILTECDPDDITISPY